MKKLSIFVYCIGVSIVLLFWVKVMGFLDKFITNDKQLLMLLFLGICTCCVAFLIDTVNITPYSRYQLESKKRSIRYLIYSIGCFVLLTILTILS